MGRRLDAPDPRSLLDTFKGAVDVLLARDLVSSKARTDRTWVETDAVIHYGCPSLRLLEDSRVETVTCPLHVRAHLRPWMETAPPGIIGRLKETLAPKSSEIPGGVLNLPDVSRDQDLHIARATARLSIEDNDLMIKIEDLEIDMDLDWGLPGDIIGKVSAWIMEQAVERFPPPRIPLPLESMMIPVLGVFPTIRLENLDSGEGRIDLYVGLDFAEVPPPVSSMPRFLADTRLKMVHRHGCPSGHLVPEEARTGYFSLHDALSGGYRGCPECLPIHRNVSVGEGAEVGRSVEYALKRLR